MNVPEQICNMTLSRLGNKNTVSSISDPKTPEDRIFAIWYDPCRQIVLKKLMPNFALGRKVVAMLSTVPAFGYAYAYQEPVDCLKVLGIGDVQDKENNYSVENGQILTDEEYADGMNLRYVKDETDVTKFTIEFIMTLVSEMADKISLQITQNPQLLTAMNALIKIDQLMASALNGQENTPVRKNVSKFKLAKLGADNPSLYNKK